MGERDFFQISVALIPVLLFGGAFVDRSREPPQGEIRLPHLLIAFAIPLCGLVAITAEMVSIQGVVGGGVTTAGRLLVIVVILGGMTFIVGSASAPRLRHIYKRLEGNSGTAGPLLAGVLSFGIFFLGISIAYRVNKTLDTSESNAKALTAKKLFERDQVVVRRMEDRRRRENELRIQIVALRGKRDIATTDKYRLRTLRSELRAERKADRFDARLDDQLHRHAYYLLSHR